jgi:hypothetical protein
LQISINVKKLLSHIHCLFDSMQFIANKIVSQEFRVFVLVQLTKSRFDDWSARFDRDPACGLFFAYRCSTEIKFFFVEKFTVNGVWGYFLSWKCLRNYIWWFLPKLIQSTFPYMRSKEPEKFRINERVS